MNLRDKNNLQIIRIYLFYGFLIGVLYAFGEYFARIDSDDPQFLIPLILRTTFTATIISGTMGLFELSIKEYLFNKPFIYLVLVKAIAYTIIISFYLLISNAIWSSIENDISIFSGLQDYLSGKSFWINMITIFPLTLIFTGLRQIDNLHRKSELTNYILGKYNKPREITRIFCFIDLVGSTSIAEKLGHYKYGLFLKDYYYDITEAIKNTKAEIYQYVGDEIVLNWPSDIGLKNNNVIRCYFMMKELIENKKEKYLYKYGFFPRFKAGTHGGPITVTWVGDIKKEIIYIGDVVNTTARIQELCKNSDHEFLISEDVISALEDLKDFEKLFVEEFIPRGKEKKVKIFSIKSRN